MHGTTQITEQHLHWGAFSFLVVNQHTRTHTQRDDKLRKCVHWMMMCSSLESTKLINDFSITITHHSRTQTHTHTQTQLINWGVWGERSRASKRRSDRTATRTQRCTLAGKRLRLVFNPAHHGAHTLLCFSGVFHARRRAN